MRSHPLDGIANAAAKEGNDDAPLALMACMLIDCLLDALRPLVWMF